MTKNKLKLGLVICASVLSVGASSAIASNLNWDANTDISLTGPSLTVTVVAGSKADSQIIGASTITVTVTSPDSYRLRSANKYKLTNDSNIPITCDGGVSEIVINNTSTVVITPTSDTCTVTPGGGSSGGGSSTPPADTTAPISTSISINAGASATTTTSVTLTLGAADSSGVSSMMISNDSAFTGAVFETYSTSKAWTLTSGNGVKTVYAKFKDAAGNVWAAFSDRIT